MAIVTGLLTFILVLISLFLILLVLVQLPKKEAGVGMAFGAGMSEMLLGAGSGNVLTRITKYTVGIFLGLSLVLSILISSRHREGDLGVSRAIEEQARSGAPAPVTPPPVTPRLQTLPLLDTTGASGSGETGADGSGLTLTSIVVNPSPVAPATAPVLAPAPGPGVIDTNQPAVQPPAPAN